LLVARKVAAARLHGKRNSKREASPPNDLDDTVGLDWWVVNSTNLNKLPYTDTSPTRERHPPRNPLGPYAEAYGRVLRGCTFL
jgi:hypothetical protein